MRGMLVAVTLALQAPVASQSGTGTIQGVVTRSDGAAPIPDADVYLNRGATAGGPAATQNRVGTATSDEQGKFEFKNLQAGTYTVTVQHPRYFGTSPNAPNPSQSVAVSSNGIAEVSIPMIPAAVIRGRVRDAFGQFASNVTVEALMVVYRNGLPMLERVVSKTSDDRGEYRLFGIPPGEYYIGITPRLPALVAAGAARSTRTYYPGVVGVADARRFTIHGGEDIADIDIAYQTPQLYKVSGRVTTTLTPQPAPPTAQGAFAVIAQNQNNTISIFLVSRELIVPDEGEGPGTTVSVSSSSGGQFEIPYVLPGSYELMAAFTDRAGTYAVARTVVDVRNQDVGGLVLNVKSGGEVKGTITIDGRGAEAGAAKVALEPADALRKLEVSLPGTIGGGGAFTIPGAPDGLFRIRVSGLLPSLYVEDMRQGATSVYDNGFEIRSASMDPIQIIVKSGAGTLQGTAQDGAGKPAAGAAVVLVPLTRRENPSLYYNSTADAQGKFTLTGIAPGEYKLFAFDGMPPTAYYNAIFLQKYEERGMSLTMTPSVRMTAAVTVLPR